MSLTPSRPESSTTRSAISLALALAFAGCSNPVPPTAQIMAPGSWHVGVALQLDGSTSMGHEGTAPLGYHWTFTALPPRSNVRFNDDSLAKPSFVPDQVGSYGIQLIVDQNTSSGLLTSAPVVANVDVKNDCAPSVVSFTPPAMAVDVGTVVPLIAKTSAPCDGNVAGKDPIVAWRWYFASTPAGSKATIAQANLASASFVPDVHGDYDVVLQVTDALGLMSDPTDPKSHQIISVAACGDNAPQVASISAAPMMPDVGTSVTLSAMVTHADTLPPCNLTRSFTYQWSLAGVPAGSAAALNNPAVASPSFTPDVPGAYTVSLTVTDDLGHVSRTQTQVVNTTSCGAAIPTVQAVGPTSAVNVGTHVQLGAMVADTDNPAADGLDSLGAPAGTPTAGACALALAFAYRWQLLDAPQGSSAALNDTTLANPSFTADQPGNYTLSVTVTASTGKQSAPSTITVTAGACGSILPVATIVAPATAVTRAPIALSTMIVDANATGACSMTVAPFSYAWRLVSAPAGSAAMLSGASPVDGTSAQQSPSLVPDLPGSYQIGLTVTDALGLTSAPAAPVTIAVNPCGSNAALNVSVLTTPSTTPELSQNVSLTASVNDMNSAAACGLPSVAPFRYAWSLTRPSGLSTATLQTPTAASAGFTPDVSGNYGYSVTVTDALGFATTASGTIGVADCTLTPTVMPASLGNAATFSSVQLTASYQLPSPPSTPACPYGGSASATPLPVSYHWSFDSMPPGSNARFNNSEIANPTFTLDKPSGTWVVHLAVTDDVSGATVVAGPFSYTSSSCGSQLPMAAALITGQMRPASFSTNPAMPTLLGTITLGGGTNIQLDATISSDPNVAGGCVSPLTYRWQIYALPAGSNANVNPPTAARPTMNLDRAGSYVLSLVVNDGPLSSLPIYVQINTQ